MAVLVGKNVECQINGVSAEVIDLTQYDNGVRYRLDFDSQLPHIMVPRLELRIKSCQEIVEWLHPIIGKVCGVYLRGGGIIHRDNGWLARVNNGPSDVEVEFLQYPPNSIKNIYSPWVWGVDDKKLNDPNYLNIAADWHADRGEVDIERHLRAAADRITRHRKEVAAK